MHVPPDVRADVLRYTSALTVNKGDPVAVVVNASPLVGWLEGAADAADLEVRRMALCRQHTNRCGADPDDDPDRFLTEARTIYAFLAAGTTGAELAPADVGCGFDEPDPPSSEGTPVARHGLEAALRAHRSLADRTQCGPGDCPAEAADGSHHLAKGASDPMNTTMADPAPQAESHPAEADRLLTPGEVAALFRVDPKTVTRWAAAGRIASLRTPGGHRRFRESLVRALLTADGVA
jgi:excisionase family DNA binding protein